MTATVDFTMQEATAVRTLRTLDGGGMVARAVFRLMGAALVLAALLLWVMPGSSWDSEVILFKLLLAAVAGLGGLGLCTGSTGSQSPEIEIDMIRRELRLMRPGRSGRQVLLRKCRFADLSRVDEDGGHLRLWDEGGLLLADVTVSDARTMRRVLAALRDAGKLN